MSQFIFNEYYDWLCSRIQCASLVKTHSKLIGMLHTTDFIFTMPMDGNRAEDGVSLRYRFGGEKGYDSRYIATELDIMPCSMFEMMVALANRLEESIMDDPDVGNRTAVWFWDMIYCLGLMDMRNECFNAYVVDDILTKFFDHKYEPDGRGGLFVVKYPRKDMRSVEIWYQAQWYLDEILHI